jgi:flagellar FliJ protein
MSIVKSVLLAIDLATTKRDQAGKVLQHVQRAQIFAQDQMAQLTGYAAETEAKWSAAAQTTCTTPELMRHHYQFMDRLNHAIALQTVAIDSAAQKVDAAKQLVLDADIRLASLQHALKKKQSDIALVQSRRDQKQTDEFASLRSAQSSGGMMGGDRHEY